MSSRLCVCCLSALLLITGVGTGPVPDLQSVKHLLEEELHAVPRTPSDLLGVGDGDTDKSVFGAPGPHTWGPADSSNSALDAKEDIFGRLMQDLVKTSKRSWSRYRKGGLRGGLRSCFGVRLDRIGSFSGLGC
ncbi:natriuretic peptide A-like [Antennarius striatus]|uniref:natriuretic peptide A-like n=1 Tax=Antennarius striatus TaxID=241820 RepID=UPI0035AE1995